MLLGRSPDDATRFVFSFRDMGGDKLTRHLRTTRLANVRVINGSDSKKTGGEEETRVLFFLQTRGKLGVSDRVGPG